MGVLFNCTAVYVLGLWVIANRVKIRSVEDMATVAVALAILHVIILFGFGYWVLTLPI